MFQSEKSSTSIIKLIISITITAIRLITTIHVFLNFSRRLECLNLLHHHQSMTWNCTWLHLSDCNNLDNLTIQITGQPPPSVWSSEYDTSSIHSVGPDTQSRFVAVFFPLVSIQEAPSITKQFMTLFSWLLLAGAVWAYEHVQVSPSANHVRQWAATYFLRSRLGGYPSSDTTTQSIASSHRWGRY